MALLLYTNKGIQIFTTSYTLYLTPSTLYLKKKLLHQEQPSNKLYS